MNKFTGFLGSCPYTIIILFVPFFVTIYKATDIALIKDANKNTRKNSVIDTTRSTVWRTCVHYRLGSRNSTRLAWEVLA